MALRITARALTAATRLGPSQPFLGPAATQCRPESLERRSIPRDSLNRRRLHTSVPALVQNSSPSIAEAGLQACSLFTPEVIIFDKDGTLVCFHTMWNSWCEQLAQRMNAETTHDLTDNVYELMGYDSEKREVKMGMLAEKTHPYIRDKVVEMLVAQGFSEWEAAEVLEKTWKDTPEDMQIKATGNLRALFARLKEKNIKIAICTSDSREGTVEFLEKLGLDSMVDMVVCGDDKESKSKPDPHNAEYICRELGTTCSEAIMVGDTPADTIMGQAANLGLTVGVLTGVGGYADLSHADIIVQDVSAVVELITPQEGANAAEHHNVAVTQRGLSKITKRSQLLQPKDRLLKQGRGRNMSTGFVPKRQMSSAHVWESKEYNKIVVGAGSAGCVLASRLSEDPETQVLVLEAGPKDTILGSKALSWKIHMPAALTYNLCDDKYNWYYHTLPQEHCNNRTMYWPRGRVWGGSSSLNAMAYVRGHAEDYNRWEREGAGGWSYESCLPYFRKAQTHSQGEDEYRGGSGPLHVSRGASGNPLHEAWLEAGQQAGYPLTEDMNGFQQEGVGRMDATIHKGQRWSAASAYLRPALSRPNITTMENVLVTRVVMEGKRAVGVELKQGDKVRHIRAQEVILSGGAINSPQLLLLSGIGPKSHLQEVGVECVHDLSGVGENLQDHLELYVAQQCSQPVSLLGDQGGLRMIKVGLQWFLSHTGSAATSHLEAGGFLRSREGVTHPDIQLHFLPSQVIDHGRVAPSLEAFQAHVGPMRATSRGWLRLASGDPTAAPRIQPNYLSTEQDRWEMRQCVRLTREIFGQEAFDQFRGPELAPGAEVQSDAELDDFVRAKSDSAYHPSCTCAMGDNDMAVVDNEARVHGLEGLRVVDASIMPSIASGNLNAPVIMLAEKLADSIRGRSLAPATGVAVYKPDITRQR